MSDSTALCGHPPNELTPPATDLSALPVRLTKRLWVTPVEFLVTTHALRLAEWALTMREHLRPSLPDPSRRGPKPVYRDSSVMVMALTHVAWQLSTKTQWTTFGRIPTPRTRPAFRRGVSSASASIGNADGRWASCPSGSSSSRWSGS